MNKGLKDVFFIVLLGDVIETVKFFTLNRVADCKCEGHFFYNKGQFKSQFDSEQQFNLLVYVYIRVDLISQAVPTWDIMHFDAKPSTAQRYV